MITREITPQLLEAASEYPVVTLLGPRQSGKTTLVRMTFPDMPYRSLEDPDTRLRAERDPRAFLSDFPDGVILDEIQTVPELLSYIQGIVDGRGKKSQFILTGSHQPRVHQGISQTLAGRTAVLILYPFTLKELSNYSVSVDPFERILHGCFPRLYEEKLTLYRFFNSYILTHVERDVRAIIRLKDLRLFQNMLTLLAGRTGQIVNASSLANDAGVSSTTIKEWISVLEASHILFELPPYFENISKRVIKSPKNYFCDTGLACFLIGLTDVNQAKRDPLRGHLYENLVILEILKTRLNHDLRPDLFFFRDNRGNEVDLIIRKGRRLYPVEIKSAETFQPEFLKGIRRFRDVAGDRVAPGTLLMNCREPFTYEGVRVFNPLIHEGLKALTL